MKHKTVLNMYQSTKYKVYKIHPKYEFHVLEF